MKLGSGGKLKSVSDAEIVQEEECREVREWEGSDAEECQ